MNFDAEFYTVRSRQSGQHCTGNGGYTQDIDMMWTPTTREAAQALLDTLPDKENHYVVRWTMMEM